MNCLWLHLTYDCVWMLLIWSHLDVVALIRRLLTVFICRWCWVESLISQHCTLVWLRFSRSWCYLHSVSCQSLLVIHSLLVFYLRIISLSLFCCFNIHYWCHNLCQGPSWLYISSDDTGPLVWKEFFDWVVLAANITTLRQLLKTFLCSFAVKLASTLTHSNSNSCILSSFLLNSYLKSPA